MNFVSNIFDCYNTINKYLSGFDKAFLKRTKDDNVLLCTCILCNTKPCTHAIISLCETVYVSLGVFEIDDELITATILGSLTHHSHFEMHERAVLNIFINNDRIICK